MTLSAQDALVYLMVVSASSDTEMTDLEFERIDALVARTPVFAGYDRAGLAKTVNDCVDMANGPQGLEGVLDLAIAALPARLQDTGYALCVEVTAVDLRLEQEELRLLEMIRDRMHIDRLITAAIETAARARFRKP